MMRSGVRVAKATDSVFPGISRFAADALCARPSARFNIPKPPKITTSDTAIVLVKIFPTIFKAITCPFAASFTLASPHPSNWLQTAFPFAYYIGLVNLKLTL